MPGHGAPRGAGKEQRVRVGELLELDALGLRLLWGGTGLLAREITGVTATDLEDPGRFLQRGEAVLSGLVWWRANGGRRKAERFVTALSTTGSAVLLAGEETHGGVPDDVLAACRAQRIAVIAVPAHTSFRAITDAVYLRQWSDLSRRPDPTRALPAAVRAELAVLTARQAPVDALLACGFSRLPEVACRLVTPVGRTLAATPGAGPVAREAVRACVAAGVTTPVPLSPAASPYDTPHLWLADPGAAPPRMVHEIAEALAQRLAADADAAVERRRAGDRLAGLLTAAAPQVADALAACGLPADGPAVVVTVRAGAEHGDGAAAALGEALACLPGVPFAVGAAAGGEALGVVAAGAAREVAATLRALWPALAACAPGTPLHAGVGEAAGPAGLGGGLAQARYALAAARSAAPDGHGVRSAADLTTLPDLVAGLPAPVRNAFHQQVLGRLMAQDDKTGGPLLETLRTFLAHDGSWSRSAAALHVHVNTVHYRVERIQTLTGRDLGRLADRLDLRTALLCAPGA